MEFHESNNVSFYLSNLSPVSEFISQRQNIGLYKHPLLGKVLIINDEIQHIENYQHLYHEPLVHIPASFIEFPKNCLIIGGGSLFAAFEILKYPSIEKVVLCDYDHTVIDLITYNYDHAIQVKSDKRFHFVEEDASIYIKKVNEKFDLIISDCFNFTEMNNDLSMYEELYQLCSEQGVCSDVMYRHIFDTKCLNSTMKLLKSQKKLVFSLIVIPEYPGVLHILTIWGKNQNINQNQKCTINRFQQNLTNSKRFKMYVPDHLPYYLYLPPYIKEIVL